MWVGGWEFLISFTFARRMRVYKISRLMQNKCLFHGGIYTEHRHSQASGIKTVRAVFLGKPFWELHENRGNVFRNM